MSYYFYEDVIFLASLFFEKWLTPSLIAKSINSQYYGLLDAYKIKLGFVVESTGRYFSISLKSPVSAILRINITYDLG